MLKQVVYASCPRLLAKQSALWSSADLMILPNVSDSVSWKHFVLWGCPLLHLLPGDQWLGDNVNTTQV